MKVSVQIVYITGILGWAALLHFPCRAPAKAQTVNSEVVTVVPEETNELLANPGMGWETFHRTCEEDKNLPDWIPSTVHYARWGWGTLEPQPAEIDYAFLDGVLKETREAGQRLAFRVMCCSTRADSPYHPAWLKDVGGKILACDYGGRKGFLIPDLDDPVVLELHLNFIERLGARYDGHADIDHVDLGTVGWWGEWHMSGSKTGKMPTMENRRRIIDAYLTAFRKTPLLMLIGGRECLIYAAQQGAGWRADCLGDMGGFSKTWCHMRNAYPELVTEADVDNVWKKAPVAWESCWDMRRWVSEDWPLRFIFNYALALHGSYLNNKSAPIPEGEEVRREIERFLRRLGYRLVVRELKHPKRVRRGEPLKLTMKWQNVGSAPCYRPYRLAYRLTNNAGSEKTLPGKVTVEKWMPGSIKTFTPEFFKEPMELPGGDIVEVVDRVTLPGGMPSGIYRLAIGVIGEQANEPILRLAIKGRTEDGWYPLSKLEVSE
jgi:hypothetical protein